MMCVCYEILQGGKWQCAHIDEIVEGRAKTIPILKLKGHPMSEVFNGRMDEWWQKALMNDCIYKGLALIIDIEKDRMVNRTKGLIQLLGMSGDSEGKHFVIIVDILYCHENDTD